MPAESETIEEELSALLWSKMAKCWGTVQDLESPERLTVVLRMQFDQAGHLMGPPEVISPLNVAQGDEAMQTAVERALRAVKACAPYSELPIEHYDVWKTITFRFTHAVEPLAIS